MGFGRRFSRAPGQANPGPDAYGNAGVWSYRAGPAVTPGADALLEGFTTNKFGVEGLLTWWGDFVSIDETDRLPAVGVNTTGASQALLGNGPNAPVTWPSGAAIVHPFDEAVVVQWRSPITGDVSITGSASLAQHPNCGNGVAWSLRSSSAVLRSGTITDLQVGRWDVPSLTVAAGNSVFLVIDARNGSYDCDSTLVALTISTTPPTSPAVNLVQNGSFETGGASPAPWIFRHDVQAGLSVDTTDAADGASSAKVTVAATSASPWLIQLRQEGLSLTGATSYTVTFWAKASVGRVANARLQSSVAPYRTLVAKDFWFSSVWQRFTFSYFASSAARDVFVGFNLAQATGVVWLDDVAVRTTNLIADGGFEAGEPTVSPWVWRNDLDASASRDTTVKSAGAASAKITIPTADSRDWSAQLRQPVAPLVVHAHYQISFAAKSSRNRRANVRLQSGAAPYPTEAVNAVQLTTAWKQYTFLWTPRTNVVDPFLAFNLSADTGTVWIDEVTLVETPPGTISTVVGGGNGGDGSRATAAALHGPQGICFDPAGNLYVSDYNAGHIRKVSPAGTITTAEAPGQSTGPIPAGCAVDAAGNLYFVSAFATGAGRVSKMTPSGIITTIAGNPNLFTSSGDGGPATQAGLTAPSAGLVFDAAGNLYVGDGGDHGSHSSIRKISPAGIITTAVGNGLSGFSGDGGPATAAQLNDPLNMAFDTAGNMYIADNDNGRIRKVTPNGIITTFAGNGTGVASGDGGPANRAGLFIPQSVVVDPAGNVYIADYGANNVRRVAPNGIITTIIGNRGGFSGDGGPAVNAGISNPTQMTIDTAGNLYISDYYNNRVRMVTAPYP